MLKLVEIFKTDVAPLVGAWIEIKLGDVQWASFCVAPLVGAWIEIFQPVINIELKSVAPLVGTWIEIV